MATIQQPDGAAASIVMCRPKETFAVQAPSPLFRVHLCIPAFAHLFALMFACFHRRSRPRGHAPTSVILSRSEESRLAERPPDWRDRKGSVGARLFADAVRAYDSQAITPRLRAMVRVGR